MNWNITALVAEILIWIVLVAFALYGVLGWAEKHWEGWKEGWKRWRAEVAESRRLNRIQVEKEHREHEAEAAKQDHRRQETEKEYQRQEAERERRRQEADKERQCEEAELRKDKQKALDEWRKRDIGDSRGLYFVSGLSAIAGLILLVVAVTRAFEETAPEFAAIRQITWTIQGTAGLILLGISGVLYGLGKLINRS